MPLFLAIFYIVREQVVLNLSICCISIHEGLDLDLSLCVSDLFIERFCMTGGSSPIGYLKAWHTNLYLSADAEKVKEALAEGEDLTDLRFFFQSSFSL